MSRFNLAVLAAIPVFASSVAFAAAPSATGSSSALNASVTLTGAPTESLTNQLLATFTAPPTGKATPVTKTNYSATKSFLQGELVVTDKAKKVVDTAEGKVASGATTARGSSTITTPSVTLVAHGQTVLTGSASKILSIASVSKKATGTPKLTTKVSLTGLTVSAPFFGIDVKNLTIASAKPNQVLAKNSAGTVKLIANRQVQIKTGGKVTGVSVDAIDLQLKNYNYNGFIVSGDIALANSTAK